MTRKDYIVIADVLAAHNNGTADFYGLVTSMAVALDSAYPNFNKDIFVKAATHKDFN